MILILLEICLLKMENLSYHHNWEAIFWRKSCHVGRRPYWSSVNAEYKIPKSTEVSNLLLLLVGLWISDWYIRYCSTLYWSSRTRLLQARSPDVVSLWTELAFFMYLVINFRHTNKICWSSFLWEGVPLTTSTTGWLQNVIKLILICY